jgi:hypothetical protein
MYVMVQPKSRLQQLEALVWNLLIKRFASLNVYNYTANIPLSTVHISLEYIWCSSSRPLHIHQTAPPPAASNAAFSAFFAACFCFSSHILSFVPSSGLPSGPSGLPSASSEAAASVEIEETATEAIAGAAARPAPV